jgi:two-component system, LytTR family, response regulator
MIRTVIIDDEPRNIKLIDGIIRDHCPGLDVVGSTDNLAEVVLLVQKLKPSLLLLDIEFPAGNIFPVLEKLAFATFHIIFITAHNTYAAEAFKQNTVDYILKPVTSQALVNAVKRVEERIYKEARTDISKLVQELKSGIAHARKIPIPTAEGILFIQDADIIRCEASGRYTVLYLANQKKLTVTKTLKEIEALLQPGQFFRVHHSHIINLDMIKKYQRGHGGMVELTDGSQVEVSASRKDELLNVLLNKSGDKLH